MAKPPAAAPQLETLVPLLQGKQALDEVTTYICQNFACQAPLVGAAALEEELKK